MPQAVAGHPSLSAVVGLTFFHQIWTCRSLASYSGLRQSLDFHSALGWAFPALRTCIHAALLMQNSTCAWSPNWASSVFVDLRDEIKLVSKAARSLETCLTSVVSSFGTSLRLWLLMESLSCIIVLHRLLLQIQADFLRGLSCVESTLTAWQVPLWGAKTRSLYTFPIVQFVQFHFSCKWSQYYTSLRPNSPNKQCLINPLLNC